VEKKTVLESISSHIVTKAIANTVAIVGATATPLAAFVPFLVDALASGRQGKRLDSMFSELTALITQHSDQIKEISDDQYKVINEAVSAAFYTIDQRKLDILKNAAANAFTKANAVANVSDALSRVLRDISSAEAAFVVQNFGFGLIVISDDEIGDVGELKTLAILPNSEEEIILSGLINLGLVYARASRFGLIGFEWSPLVVKLIILLKDAS
jgi:hypothetical protein